MSSPLTDARNELMGLLIPLGYRVYSVPTEVPSPPCIQIFANNTWISSPRLHKGAVDVSLWVRLSVPTKGGNEQAFELLEQMTWEVINTLVITGTTMAPKLDTSSQTESLVVDLEVRTTIK